MLPRTFYWQRGLAFDGQWGSGVWLGLAKSREWRVHFDHHQIHPPDRLIFGMLGHGPASAQKFHGLSKACWQPDKTVYNYQKRSEWHKRCKRRKNSVSSYLMASLPIKRLVSPELPATGSETPVITKNIHLPWFMFSIRYSKNIHLSWFMLSIRYSKTDYIKKIISHSHCLFLFRLHSWSYTLRTSFKK